MFVIKRRRRHRSTHFPYTTLFRSGVQQDIEAEPPPGGILRHGEVEVRQRVAQGDDRGRRGVRGGAGCHLRSEEHTSELQSRRDLVCRLLLEKKKNSKKFITYILDK